MFCSPFVEIIKKIWDSIPEIKCKSTCCYTIQIIRRNTINFAKGQRDAWRRGTSEP